MVLLDLFLNVGSDWWRIAGRIYCTMQSPSLCGSRSSRLCGISLGVGMSMFKDVRDMGIRGNFEAYRSIVKALRRELGVFRLPGADGGAENFYNEISAFLVGVQEVEYFLDAVELICRVVEENSNNFYSRGDQRQREKAKAAIEELNLRFKEHGVGYQYDDEIIRVDSALLHAEAVKPALALLRDAKFKGAEEEFLSAVPVITARGIIKRPSMTRLSRLRAQ